MQKRKRGCGEMRSRYPSLFLSIRKPPREDGYQGQLERGQQAQGNGLLLLLNPIKNNFP